MVRVQNSPFVLAMSVGISALAIAAAGAIKNEPLVALLSAFTALFFVAIGAGAVRDQNAHHGSAPPDRLAKLLSDLNAIYTFVFLWGGAALLLLYTVSGLKWQHGWQYALGFFTFALAHRSFAWPLDKHAHPETRRQIAQTAYNGLKIEAFLIASTLVWLVASGKLSTQKGDWAANYIFLAGGVSVVYLTFRVSQFVRNLSDP